MKKAIFFFRIVFIFLSASTLTFFSTSCKSSTSPDPPITTRGSIQVNSTPTGAQVFLDGNSTGKTTNCTLSNVSPGNHTLKLVKDGHVDYFGTANVTVGHTTTINATFSPNTVLITLPAESTIWIKGSQADIHWQVTAIGAGQAQTLDIAKVKIDLYKGGTLITPPIAAETNNSGAYLWTVEEDLTAGTDYQVRISCSTDESVFGESKAFRISEAAGLAVTPESGLVSSGTVSGTFSPSSQIYTLQNTGVAALNWTAGKTQAWTTLSVESGTLVTDASVTVTVSINSNADSLEAGSYSDTVTFTNTTNGTGNTTRPVSLAVSAQPILSVTPSTRDVEYTAGTTAFSVSNTGTGTMAWTATVMSGSAWLSISSGSNGSNSGTITVAASANAGTASRTGTIRVTATDATGSPKDVTVAQAAPAQPSLSVTPTDGLSSIGPVGGPFTPSSITYTLQNTGGLPLNWTADKTQGWTTLSAASGTLSANASTSVIASINETANTIEAGSYNDTVTFTNTTNGAGNQSRPLMLMAALPDLVVEVSYSPARPTTMDAITITAVVKNIGTVAAGASALYIDGQSDLRLPRGYRIQELPAGGTQAVTWVAGPIINPSGYALIAFADTDREVAEANEDNNRTSLSIFVTGVPDLEVTSLTGTAAGATITVNATVTSLLIWGPVKRLDSHVDRSIDDITPASVLRLTVYVASTLLETKDLPIPGLEQGQSADVSTTFTIPGEPSPGITYTIVALADATEVVTEVNESNNERTISFMGTTSGMNSRSQLSIFSFELGRPKTPITKE